jgi:serine protease Do
MSNRQKGFIAGGVAGAALAGAAIVFAAGHGPLAVAANVAGAQGLASSSPMSFADIIQRVSPAVVSIDVSGRGDSSEVALEGGAPFALPGGGDDEDGPSQLFRQLIPNLPQGRAAPRMQATGSGFFISANGYVITNNHVVQGADTITVRTADHRILKGHVVGHDPATDIAVVKVAGEGFPFVNFETAAKPRVGDWVVAVGNPFGLGGTATAGIVSALGRENVAENNLVDYMQIDAPINKGNSGGPTFDVYGRVVGVNTAIFTPSGGSVGIGFDIPADVASSVARQLIAKGRIEHGYLGATIQEITPEVADSLGLKTAQGALVAGLAPGGPASKSGLEPGDVVLKVNDRQVLSASDLTRQVAFSSPGEPLRLLVLRQGRETSLTVRSGIRPAEAELARADRSGGAEDDQGTAAPSRAVLGMRLASLTPTERARLGLGDDARGVVVAGVSPDTDAAEKGLRPGDLILRAGDHAARAPEDVAAAVADAKRAQRKSVLLMVSRNGQNGFIPVSVAPAQG